MENEPNQINKPDWFKNLEAESWQPELVVSGIAIFATLSAPVYINDFSDLCFSSLPEDVFGGIRMTQQYLTIIVYLLALNFALHFAIRVTWIGFIGLTSVYPEGISFEKLPYSDYIKSKYKEDFPNIYKITKQLDDYASMIFGFSAGLTMIIISTFSFVTILFFLSKLIGFFLPVGFLKDNLFDIFGGFFILIALAASVLNLKYFHKNEAAQRFYYKYMQVFSKVIFAFFYRPVQYIVLTFISHVNLKKLMGLYFGYSLFLGLIAGIVMAASGRSFMRSTAFNHSFNYTAKPYTVFPDYYENLRPTNKRITWSTLSSDVIKDDFLKVFIPQLGVDKPQLKTCEGWDTEEDNKREIRVNCFANLHQISINDTVLTDIEFMSYRHPNKSEYGIITYLDSDKLKMGKNILKIERTLEGEEEPRVTEIPFWKR